MVDSLSPAWDVVIARGGMALRGAFTRFQPADTVQWFEERGAPLKTEADG